MTKSQAIEVLEELAYNFKREVTITEEASITDENAEKELKSSIVYILECCGVSIDESDITIDLDL